MARLSKEARAKLKKSVFAIPEKAPGPGSYPMPDKKHAIIAMALAAMHAGPEIEARVRRAAYRKFPELRRGKSKSKRKE